MKTVWLAREAMHTRFEFVLHGADELRLRAAGEEALDEVGRLEERLSLFRSTSEIARLNRQAAEEAVLVSPEVFDLLGRMREWWVLSEGAFDPTVGAAMAAWGFRSGQLGPVRGGGVAGMDKVRLDPQTRRVRFTEPGVSLDLGAVGKGYALDRAAEILRETGITSGLLHGGTSSVHGLGRAPGGGPWRVAIPAGRPQESAAPTGSGVEEVTVELVDASLGVSAAWGRTVRADGREVGHVMDPRTGRPAASGASLAAVVVSSAAEADALSTALLVQGAGWLPRLRAARPGAWGMVG